MPIQNTSRSQGIPAHSADEAAIEPPAKDVFDRIGKKGYLVVFLLTLTICFLIFKSYLLLQKVYYFKEIRNDSYNFLYPYLHSVSNYISHSGIPKWSFRFGMGQNLFPFCLRDPFDIFLYIAGTNNIYYSTIYIEVMKFAATALVFYAYLKQLKLPAFVLITGTMLFTFCGFMTGASPWHIFSYEVFNAALLLLAFELLFSKEKWFLFPIAVFGFAISMPFNLAIYGFFMAVYALFRFLHEGKQGAKQLGILFLKMSGLAVLGLLLAGPFLLENVLQLLYCPRVSGPNSFVHVFMSKPIFALPDRLELGTCIVRFFSNDILGNGYNGYKGWRNVFEAPMFYCGLPCLLLVPQVFQFLKKGTRIAFIIFMSAWLLPILFPYFRRAFWLFTGDYYRTYSFIVAFLFIFYSAFALNFIAARRQINMPVLAITMAILIALLFYPFFTEKDAVDPVIRGFAIAALLVYGALFYWMTRANNSAWPKALFMLLLIGELCYLSGITANDRDAVSRKELEAKEGYNDNTTDLVKGLKKNDPSFYRIDKYFISSALSYYGSLNDAPAQDYNGTSSYNPFNQLGYAYYLQTMGIARKDVEGASRWAMGLLNNPILEAENRVKYILTKTAISPQWRPMWDSITTIGGISLFRNKYLLPFGYSYSQVIRESTFDSLCPKQREYVSLMCCVVKDRDIATSPNISEFRLKDTLTNFDFSLLRNRIDLLSEDSLQVTTFQDCEIKGTVTAHADKIMYLSIPQDKGWKLMVDGKEQTKMVVFGGMTGILLSKGTHLIELSFDLVFFNIGLLMSLFGITIFVALLLYQKRKPTQ